MIVRKGQAEHGLQESIGEDEEERVRDSPRESCGRVLCDPRASDGPETRVDISIQYRNLHRLTEEARNEAELCFCPAVRLAFVVCLLVYFCLEGLGADGALENLVLTEGEVAL